MDEIVFRHHIFPGPDQRWEADPHGLADFTGHSLESGAQEIALVTIQDFHFGQGKAVKITKEIFQVGGNQLTSSEDADTIIGRCWVGILKLYSSEVSWCWVCGILKLLKNLLFQ
jgi:hypothetical protein